VADQIERNEIGYFPVNRAMSLSNEDSTMELEIQEVKKTLQSLVQRFKEEDVKKEEDRQKVLFEKWKQAAQHEDQ